MLPGVIPTHIERCRVLPRPEEILVLHLHGERRGRADRPAGRGARLGRARQHCSTGSIERTGSADIGRRRSCRSAIRLRSAATWISRRPPMRPARRARQRNAGSAFCAAAPPAMNGRGRPPARALRYAWRTSGCPPFAQAAPPLGHSEKTTEPEMPGEGSQLEVRHDKCARRVSKDWRESRL